MYIWSSKSFFYFSAGGVTLRCRKDGAGVMSGITPVDGRVRGLYRVKKWVE